MKTLIFLLLPLFAFGQFGNFGNFGGFASDDDFSPLDVDNLIAWYDAGEGITTNGPGNVTLWEDQSGNGFDLRSINPNQPAYTTNAINGKPAITFDATNTERLYRLSGIGPTGNALLTIFVVATGTNSGRLINIGDSSGAAGTVIIASFEDETTPPDPSARWNNGNKRWQNTDVTSFSALCWKFKGGQYGDTELWQNDALQTSTAEGNPTNTANITNEEIRVGFGRNPSAVNTAYLSGQIAEIIIYNVVLSTGETTQVFNYINNKYSLY